MMTRIAGNSGKRNGKSFRMNAGAANFYVILHVVCRLTRLLTIRATIWAAPFFETVRNFDTRGSLLVALSCARADAP